MAFSPKKQVARVPKLMHNNIKQQNVLVCVNLYVYSEEDPAWMFQSGIRFKYPDAADKSSKFPGETKKQGASGRQENHPSSLGKANENKGVGGSANVQTISFGNAAVRWSNGSNPFSIGFLRILNCFLEGFVTGSTLSVDFYAF